MASTTTDRHDEPPEDGRDPAPAPGRVVIVRASRLEALVPPLLTLLDADRPDDVLAPQTVVAAHPGMKQWLVGAMAKARGPHGIVANLDVLLPSTWLERTATRLLGDRAVALPAWRRARLRWSVLAFLQSPGGVAALADPRIGRYLDPDRAAGDGDLARRRFQLADRLAGVLSQYLVYRGDWLRAWERGDDRRATAGLADPGLARLEAGLLAPLWRHLAASLGPHRATVVERLLAALRRPVPAAAAVHVFGLSHLPPAELGVLRAWSAHAPVFLYVPDPCREYWGGLVPADEPARLRAWRDDEQARIDAAGAGEWLDDTPRHPLLARWGRLGQHFYAGLADWDATRDIRHAEDLDDRPPADLLARVQDSVRRLDRALVDDPEPLAARVAAAGDEPDARRAAADAWFAARRADPSLRVHACHTRLRELEVLRDALLDAAAAGIAPGGIVVMAPDIAAYAPLLPAVFGAPGDPREPRLPWHLADAPAMRSHRLFATFARLLDLGASRIAAPDIVDLLAVPEIAGALGLDADGRDALVDWLKASRAAWALDGAHRADFGVPPTDANTLGWGLDRMLAGYVFAAPGADATAPVTLPDGTAVLPLGGIHGPAAAAVGAFDRLLGELRHWRGLAQSTRRAGEWARELDARLAALVRIDPLDADAQAAGAAIARIVSALALDTADAGDPPLHFAVVRDVLLDALAAVPERQRFLRGGITFCGMVPQRAIPFAMVCVLGLDDGAFPRRATDGGLDLMARIRRVGDRDVRADDRWLFLETLMSARRRLHLSFVGQDARDGSARNPASPLAELLGELERGAGAHGVEPELAARARPWWVAHPLQPFAPAYFDGADAALFSYSGDFAAMRVDAAAPAPPFLAGTPRAPDPLPDPLPLATLSRFWKDPAKDLLARRLQLDLAALDDDALPDHEPLDPRLARLDTVARRVFFAEALPAGVDADGAPRWSGDAPPAWLALGGLLPPGEPGRVAWRCEAVAVRELVRAAHACGLAGARVAAVPVDIALEVDGRPLRLRGAVADVAHGDDGTLRLVRPFAVAGESDRAALRKAGDLDLGKRVPMFVEWAALRLQTGGLSAPPPVRLAALVRDTLPLAAAIDAWDAAFLAAPARRAARLADLRARLGALAALWWQAGAAPPVYFPKTSSKAWQAAAKAAGGPAAGRTAARLAALKTFDAGFAGGERDYAPGWMRIVARGLAFDATTVDVLLAYAGRLEALLALDTAPECADA